ncbi:MAG: pyruvate, water dikinase, partial [Kribbellaceae bacterium]|nr:pyruvate, water dikinase [Kribbellaceae bacterium]
GGVVVSEVPLEERERFCLDERLVRRVMELGRAVAAELDGPQDIEFAVEGDQVWILQARPITAPLASADTTNQKTAVLLEMEPPAVLRGAEGVGGEGPGVLRADGHGGLRGEARAGVLRGVGGSAGVASGPARVVEGVGDFGRVEVGDILVCRFTDPAWTPLFGVVAGVVTEVGGRLSHAAIVARERRIPAVLGVSGVMSAVEDGQVITIVGDAGTVSAPGLGRT